MRIRFPSWLVAAFASGEPGLKFDGPRDRCGRDDKHEDCRDDADEGELGQLMGDYGKASHDAYACGDEKDRHVLQEEVGGKVDLRGIEHARDEQRKQKGHAHDIARYADGQHAGNGIAEIAYACKKRELDDEQTCLFAKSREVCGGRILDVLFRFDFGFGVGFPLGFGVVFDACCVWHDGMARGPAPFDRLPSSIEHVSVASTVQAAGFAGCPYYRVRVSRW